MFMMSMTSRNILLRLKCSDLRIRFIDPEEHILYLRNADASYQVESIIAVNADAAIRELFDRGAIDLTFYPACQEDEP